MHKRKAWQRPKSDYGNRFNTRNNKENDDSGGWGDGRGLETLDEKDDSTIGSQDDKRRGSHAGGDGGLNDKKKSGSGQDDDASKLSVCGSGLSSRRGSKDFGGRERGNKGYVKLLRTDNL